MSLFNNQVVVITGGSDGIGKALVAQFLALGAKVATCGRNENKLSLLATEFPSSNLFTATVDGALIAKPSPFKVAPGILNNVALIPQGERGPAEVMIRRSSLAVDV